MCQCENGYWSYQDDDNTCAEEEFLRIHKCTEHAGYGVNHYHQMQEVIVERLLASKQPCRIYRILKSL